MPSELEVFETHRLTPAERAVFLLHDVFDMNHAEIAAIVGKNDVACRQLLKRARELSQNGEVKAVRLARSSAHEYGWAMIFEPPRAAPLPEPIVKGAESMRGRTLVRREISCEPPWRRSKA